MVMTTTQRLGPLPCVVPHPTPSIADGEVHVWQLHLEDLRWSNMRFSTVLAPDEVERAVRYVFERDREQFIVARGLLRMILARYSECEAQEIEFGYGEHGKPFVARPTGTGLTFNLSHTHGRGLCAVARNRAVGIDIERIRPEVDILGVAGSTFSPGECAQLEALPAGDRLASFFRCWTRKEAYIKARGDGLSYPLDRFDVSLGPDEPAALVRSAEGEAELHCWSLLAIDTGPSYMAALAVEQPVESVYLFS